MTQLGVNAHGEILEPGRVSDCYLGLLLPPGPAGEPEAGTVLVVAPAALLRPGVPQPAGSLVTARAHEEALHVEVQILDCAVVFRLAHLVLGHRIERVADPARVFARHDALGGQHDEVRVMNRHQRREKQLLGVFEVFVEDVGYVFGGELHRLRP